MMWMFVCVIFFVHPTSHIFPMDINELCVSPDRIWPSIYSGGICGNANVHYLVDLDIPLFVRPNVIGGLLAIVCSWSLPGLM